LGSNTYTHKGYRADLDGLRSVAILAVVIFHTFPDILPGGFTGVDIFFVLSGYLITTNLLNSFDHKTFTYLDFYSRRIRRIFPALIVVLLTTLVAGWFILLPDEYELLGKHVFSGSFFYSNINLFREVAYFDPKAEFKPLLHLWSLAVEEQFYIFWPPTIMFLLKRSCNITYKVTFLTILSLLICLLLVSRYPSATFYMLPTRAWELLLGAVLSSVNLSQWHKSIFSKRLRIASGWLGISLVVCAFLLMNKNSLFPSWNALLPTIGCFLIIYAGDECWFNRHILCNTIPVYIGRISYPLYLWHWPLISFAWMIESKEPSSLTKFIAILLSCLFASLTYNYVEKPAQKFTPILNGTYKKAFLFCIPLLAVGIVGYIIFKNGGFASRYGLDSYKVESYFKEVEFQNTVNCKLKFPLSTQSYCGLSRLDVTPTVAVIGDSHSRHFFPGLSNYYGRKNEAIVDFGKGGCPPFLGIERMFDGKSLECNQTMENAILSLKLNPKIKTVILAAAFASYTSGLRNASDPLGSKDYKQVEADSALFERGLNEMIDALSSMGVRLIFIHQVPILPEDPKLCVNLRHISFTNKMCSYSETQLSEESIKYRKIVGEIFEKHPEITVYDPKTNLCKDGFCFANFNSEVLYADREHLNIFGSNFVAKNFNF
jgi:peptidoglycan/LPS O-acetylase OafA/YrhL